MTTKMPRWFETPFAVICDELGMTRREIFRKSRTEHLADCRSIVYLMFTEAAPLKICPRYIAAVFGTNKSTIHCSLVTAKDRLKDKKNAHNKKFVQLVDRIRNRIAKAKDYDRGTDSQ